MGDEFDSLGFTAAEGRASLTQLDVTQTGVAQRLEGSEHLGHALEQLDGFLDRKVEHLGDVFAGVADVKSFAIEARAAAGLAANKRRRQKIHLQFDDAGAFTFGTPSLGAVEAEPAGGV